MDKNALKNLKILIVDDSQMTRNVVKHFCKELNLKNTYFAYDGEDAIKKLEEAYLKSKPYHLVFMDINMPKMRGLESLEAIRNHRYQIAKVPIIMLTTENDGDIIIKAVELGATDYITKPATAEKIEQMIVKHFLNNDDD